MNVQRIICCFFLFAKDYPYTAKAPNLANTVGNTTSQTGSKRSFWPLGRRNVDEEASQLNEPSPDITFYAFQYDECAIRARDNPFVTCPNHQDLPLEFIAPDTVSQLCVSHLSHCVLRFTNFDSI